MCAKWIKPITVALLAAAGWLGGELACRATLYYCSVIGCPYLSCTGIHTDCSGTCANFLGLNPPSALLCWPSNTQNCYQFTSTDECNDGTCSADGSVCACSWRQCTTH